MKPVSFSTIQSQRENHKIQRGFIEGFAKIEKDIRNLGKRVIVRGYIKDDKLIDSYFHTPLVQRAELVKKEEAILKKIIDVFGKIKV